MIKDQLLVYDDVSILGVKCPSCQKPVGGHLVSSCSLLTYTPNVPGVIQRFMSRNQQKREIFTRGRARPKNKTLLNKPAVIKAQKIFVQLNESRILKANKGRRANIYNIQGFLNSPSIRHSFSLPLSEGEAPNNFESFDESEIKEDGNGTPRVTPSLS